jgi:hypothetical protein
MGHYVARPHRSVTEAPGVAHVRGAFNHGRLLVHRLAKQLSVRLVVARELHQDPLAAHVVKHAQAGVEKDDAVSRHGDVESETADVNFALFGINRLVESKPAGDRKAGHRVVDAVVVELLICQSLVYCSLRFS